MESCKKTSEASQRQRGLGQCCVVAGRNGDCRNRVAVGRFALPRLRVATGSFWTCVRILNLKRLISRPPGTLSSIRNGGEGWGEEALQFMESSFLATLGRRPQSLW